MTTAFHLRPATEDDVPGIVAMIHTTVDVEPSATETTAYDVTRSWKSPTFDRERNTWVAVGSDGLILGYEEVDHIGDGGQAGMDGYVRAGYTGQGIGTAMVRAAEARIRSAMPESEVHARAGTGGNDTGAHQLFQSEGYELIRFFQRMQIDLAEAPAAAEWPEGIVVRPFVRGQDERATHAAVNEAFADHWGSVPTEFDEWVTTRIETERFDASLWLLACEGDEIAGMALCQQRPDLGWVSTLGVRRPWRKRGLGHALLQHSFCELYARGERAVALGVDASSLTGATRLYTRAGMHVTEQYALFGKTLRKTDEPNQ